MEHSPELPRGTKSLRSCSGNRAKMLLKGHLGIKCHSQYNKAFGLLQYSPANSQSGWLGIYCAWPGDYHSPGLTSIKFHSPKVTPLTNPAKITDQGLGYYISYAWLRHNSHQSGDISITDQLIFQNGKKLFSRMEKVYRRNNKRPKHCPLAFLAQHLPVSGCDGKTQYLSRWGTGNWAFRI